MLIEIIFEVLFCFAMKGIEFAIDHSFEIAIARLLSVMSTGHDTRHRVIDLSSRPIREAIRDFSCAIQHLSGNRSTKENPDVTGDKKLVTPDSRKYFNRVISATNKGLSSDFTKISDKLLMIELRIMSQIFTEDFKGICRNSKLLIEEFMNSPATRNFYTELAFVGVGDSSPELEAAHEGASLIKNLEKLGVIKISELKEVLLSPPIHHRQFWKVRLRMWNPTVKRRSKAAKIAIGAVQGIAGLVILPPVALFGAALSALTTALLPVAAPIGAANNRTEIGRHLWWENYKENNMGAFFTYPKTAIELISDDSIGDPLYPEMGKPHL